MQASMITINHAVKNWRCTWSLKGMFSYEPKRRLFLLPQNNRFHHKEQSFLRRYAKEVRAPLLGLYSSSMLQCCILNILRRPQKDVCLLEANGTNPFDVSLFRNRLLVLFEGKRRPCCMNLFMFFPFEPERLITGFQQCSIYYANNYCFCSVTPSFSEQLFRIVRTNLQT